MYLSVVERPSLSTISRDTTTYTISGRSGDLIVDNKRYENRELEVDCFIRKYVYDTSLATTATKIKNWLQPPELLYKKLSFSDDDEYFYEAIVINALDITEVLEYFGEFKILFTCKPFKKRLDGEVLKTYSKPFGIMNPEIFDSEPYIKIYGTGDITLNINNQSIVFKGVSEYIEVDSEMMECFKGNTLQNSKMTGSFPIFESGINSVSWTGSVSKIEVKGRWRCL